LFLEADGGTLFLDEVAEMPPSIQAKILRAIEDREIRPLGDTKSVKVDVRIISATKRDLRSSVEEQAFRQDLYFRLNVIAIKLPPLRERREDILPLTHLFIGGCSKQFGKKISRILSDATKPLMEYPWPGNVRELENAIEHAVSMARKETITVEDLPPFLTEGESSEALLAQAAQKQYTAAELEREYIKKILDYTRGNKVRAAEILGMDRKTLYRKLQGC